jgi:hypothetical protein
MLLGVVTVAACGGAGTQTGTGSSQGFIQARISALYAPTQITRITLTVSPENLSQDLTYNPSDASFTGSITVPAGDHTVTATAYVGTTVVGTATAPVTVTRNQTASVTLTIRDGPAPVPGYGPVVSTLTVPQTRVGIGDQVNVSVTTLESDSSPMSIVWSNAPSGCGTFANTSSASTTWRAATAGVCTITVTVSAGSKQDSRSVDVTVYQQGVGTVSVTGSFVEFPHIDLFYFQVGDSAVAIARTGTDATLHELLARSQVYRVGLYWDLVPGGTPALQDSCGGNLEPFGGYDGHYEWNWTSPVTQQACILTATLTYGDMVDTFPIVVTTG